MSFKDIDILPSYDSGVQDVISDFYVPVLNEAISYDRITGFFTSSSLAISARGMIHIVDNGGKIRILTSPKLTKEDAELINSALADPIKYIDDMMYLQLVREEIDIVENYKKLLAHWVAKGIVEIRVALIKENNRFLTSDEIDRKALFHQKVGILCDKEGNHLSFSGSINETFAAWDTNVEEFKTFKEWDSGQSDYCRVDIDRFNSFWNGTRNNMIIISLPEATKNKLIEWSKDIDYTNLVEQVKKIEVRKKSKDLVNKLFWYQKEAMNMWIENNHKLLFAMATGTGKTLTSIACIDYMLRKKERLLVIISTPQSFLSKQWQSEIKESDIEYRRDIIADSTNNGYKKKLDDNIMKLNLGIIDNLIIYTTHSTSHKQSFVEQIKRINTKKVKILFVGDEVHGLGSKENRNALQPFYDYRIGLSATPSRWFDDEGSDILMDYFGNEKFEFSIEQALQEINPITQKTFLTPYIYHTEFVYLTESEEDKYQYYTDKIVKFPGDDDDSKDARKQLLMKRANIVKNAENKLDTLVDLILKIQKERDIENTIIFTSEKHLKKVIITLNEMGITTYPLTKDQGSKPEKRFNGKSERDMIIDRFKSKIIKVIVAIKCMDEGIDIPSADTAILMSSTTNPREYIQRIGRVIRRYDNKRFAEVYDLVTKSDNPDINKRILNSEFKRVKYIISNATNSITELIRIYEEE